MAARHELLNRLTNGILLGDGGYVLELERRGYVQAGPYTPEVVVEFPEVVEQLHVEFKRAGAEILRALTFYGSEDKLRVVDRAHQVDAVNQNAVRIARKVAGRDAFVAGVITLTTIFRGSDSNARKHARELMAKQVYLQKEAGVDLFAGETFVNLQEALIALEVIRETGLPTMITMSIGPSGSREGVSPEECARCLASEGADIVGVNCSFDPMVSLITARKMREATDAYVACAPIGYRTPNPAASFTVHPEFPLALERWQLNRFDLAGFAVRAKSLGINIIGGCCGVAAYHIRAMAEALGRRPPASKKSPDLSRHVIPEIRKKADLRYWQSRSRHGGMA